MRVYSIIISLIVGNQYAQLSGQNQMIYDFMLILTLTQSFQTMINQQANSLVLKNHQSVSFYQQYYQSYLNQRSNDNNVVRYLYLHRQHKMNCQLLRCPCKQDMQLMSQEEISLIINLYYKNLLSQKFSEVHVLQYVLIQIDISNNTIQAHQSILNQKKNVQNGYILQIFEYLEQVLQEKLIEEMQQKQQVKFIEEMRLLKYEGFVVQQELQKVLIEKYKFYESLKLLSIQNFQKLYDSLYKLKNQVQDLIKKSKDLQIYDNSKLNNIFALRICHLISFLTQNLREQIDNQIRIDEIIQNEIYKEDEFTNIAFTSNFAISLVASLNEKEQGQITSKITTKQLQFLELDEHFVLNSISQILHVSFRTSHLKLIDQYIQKGKQKIIGTQIDTMISPDNNTIIPIKMILFPYFPKQNLNKYQLIAYLYKIKQKNNAIILLDYNFNLMCSDNKFKQLINQYQLQLNQINVFQMIPQLRENLIQFHSSTNNAKPLYFQNQLIQIMSRFARLSNSKVCNICKDLYHNNQLEKLEQFNISSVNSMSVDKISQIDYEISLQNINYETEDGQEYYIYYRIVIDLSQFESESKQKKHDNYEDNTKELIKKKNKSKSKLNDNIVRSLHSRQSTATIVKSSDDLLIYIAQKTLPTAIKQFMALSLINMCISLVGLVVIYILLLQKRNEQDVCFNRLYYGTEFLDYYGLILKGSRHTVFYRDFNNFIPYNQTINIDQDHQVQITTSEKIQFTLQLYKENCQNLINLYENYKSVLNSYQEEKLINFKFVDYQVYSVRTQVVQTQAAYYEIMNQLFYLAIKTFAGDPSLYLKGTLDTFPQINTRSILFLNFNDVCEITQEFIEACLQNSQEYNNRFDNQVQVIFYIFYIGILVFYVILIMTLSRIIYKIKQILQIFQRLDNRDIEEELQKLEFVGQNIKNEEFWFNSKFFQNFYEMSQDLSKTQGQVSQNIKLDDQFNLPMYYIMQTIILVLLIIYFVIFQIQYNSYSNQINPIVNTALSGIQIRLHFIKFINNWDSYNFKTFYNNYIEVNKNTANINGNIRGNNKILQLLELNQSEITQSYLNLVQEPFTTITIDLPDNEKASLLLDDICLLVGCDTKIELFKERFLIHELSDFFGVGLIQLYQSTFSATQKLGLNNENETKQQFLNNFLDVVFSREYFMYIFWGLDATNFQLRLFSDFFIHIAKDKLTSQTQIIMVLLFSLGIFISLLLFSINGLLIHQIISNYFSIRFTLRFIPMKVMINKNIIKQIKLII
ncbi:unnamed protein product [Paramecium sonneborni]|uniref:Transmembrane protein n=1 Tax=Paramecium sonneborni TaxID=65129 RepID=A0A8S1RJC3_9CILI|nr:unnamed protein product [Paramecium sonneborni]